MIKKFLWRTALWKGLRRVVQVVVAAVAGSKLQEYGVTIDATAMTAALTGLLETGLNAAKQKYPNKLGWL